MFIDRVTLFVKGGDGGKGCSSFRREKYIPRGGPDGGDGGDGGNVIVIAQDGADTLADIVNKKHWRADSGGPGMPDNCHGKKAQDLIIRVPPGTLVTDRDKENILKDLKSAGESVIVGKGGRGGRGNRAFATSTNRAPRKFQPGTPGEERWVNLELKLIADVGLVGKPNAGKSTLLTRLTRANVEIDSYPFTTRHPNLGMVLLGDEKAFVLADLPGLIEGAHQGIGLGLEFLRHVERTKILIHLLEPFPMDQSCPLNNYLTIRKELELHGKETAAKPEIVALSKCELTDSSKIKDLMEKELGKEIIEISAVTGKGLANLVQMVTKTLQSLSTSDK